MTHRPPQRRQMVCTLALVTWSLTTTAAHAQTAAGDAVPMPEGDASNAEATPPDTVGDDLDFDLLGEAPPVESVDTTAVQTRRVLLNVHQGLGLGLLAATTSLCVIGQLSYNDRFGGGSTGRYEQTHAILAYGTLGLFALTAAAAIFAPLPYEREDQGWDRTLVHKIALALATLAMAGSATLGILTASREGFLDQQDYGRVHLGLGYAALASMVGGVAVLVF